MPRVTEDQPLTPARGAALGARGVAGEVGADELVARIEGRVHGAAAGDVLRLRREAARILDLGAAALLAWLDATLVGDEAAARLEAMREVGVLGVVLPEVAALVGFHRSSPVHHKDLWTHTLEVLTTTPPDADLRWVALMHDVGKVATREVGPDGKVTFWRHERVGAFLMRGVAARLGMAPARAERIAFVIEHHARVNAYEPEWTDRAVRRLMRDAGERLPDLLAFSGADFTTKRAARAARIRRSLAHLSARLERLRGQDEAGRALPSGLGHALARALGLAGPELGEAMRWLEARVADGALPRGAEAEVYVAALRERAQNG